MSFKQLGLISDHDYKDALHARDILDVMYL